MIRASSCSKRIEVNDIKTPPWMYAPPCVGRQRGSDLRKLFAIKKVVEVESVSCSKEGWPMIGGLGLWVVVVKVVMEYQECPGKTSKMLSSKGFKDGAFGGVGDEEVVIGEGVVVTSSSLEILTNNCLRGIMVSLIFLEGLEEEA
ncbi:hypothetical protein Tco_0623350 [Tanacetum coccineum]